MKRVVIITLIIAFIVAIFGVTNSLSNSSSHSTHLPKTVVIDAGHGGVDAGAIAIDNTPEKEINLDIALALYDYLMVSGVNSSLIRDGDYEIYPNGYDRSKSDLYNRMDIINTYDNAIMISIHQNHFENESEHGTQIWYSTNDNDSVIIADSILNSIKYYLQPDNKRKNKESGSAYYILHNATIPSIMIECGFISNREENIKLNDKKYQADMVFTIMLGLNGVI